MRTREQKAREFPDMYGTGRLTNSQPEFLDLNWGRRNLSIHQHHAQMQMMAMDLSWAELRVLAYHEQLLSGLSPEEEEELRKLREERERVSKELGDQPITRREEELLLKRGQRGS